MAKELIFIKDNNGAATLVGVVSWGKPCAHPGYPTIYSGLYTFTFLFMNHVILILKLPCVMMIYKSIKRHID